MKILIRAAVLTGLSALAASPAVAGEKGEKWRAMSTTAIAITGDISVFSDHMVFGNGQRVSLTAVGKSGRNARIFKLDVPANPKLLNGNTLCGPKAVQFVAFSKLDATTLSLSVFDRKEAPTSSDDGPCGIYNYVK